MTYIQKTVCPYDCPTSCGLVAETDGERILRVAGDKEHPVCKGLICRKMQNYERSIHSPERILTPLKRTGKKGEGEFAPISWEEAVKEITDRWKEILNTDGGDAILPVYYSGVMGVIQRKCGDAFFNRLGACELIKTLCSSAKGAAYEATVGKTGCLDPRELKDSDFLLIWGSNVKSTRIQTMADIIRARRRGIPIVLVEACAQDMAAYCDEYFLLKPGTDGALALAMMYVLEEENLADRKFLTGKAHGYQQFKETLHSYTPQWAEKITGIPAKDIVRLAKRFGEAEAPAILFGSGPSRHGNGGMNSRLVMILSAYTGAWGKKGGGYCGNGPAEAPFVDANRVTRPDFRKKQGRKVNINELASALCCEEKGKTVKSLYVYGGNPVNSVCCQTGIVKGLLRPDLFTVVHERFMTDTAKYADIILPAAFSVEQNDCFGAYGYCTFSTARRIINPPGQCKSNWDTFCLLAKAMGFEEEYFKRTDGEMLEELLSHPEKGLMQLSDEQWKTLREGGTIEVPFEQHDHFKTKTGKFMIVNEELEEPVPYYKENYGGDYPLRLISVPDGHTLNSIFLERPELTGKRGPAFLMLHPEDAKARNIRDGAKIIAFNDLAQVEFVARLTGLVSRGTAAASGVYSSRITGTRWQFNALNHERLSDMGAATTLNDNRIDVRPL